MNFRIFVFVILCLSHTLSAEFEFPKYLSNEIKGFMDEISEELTVPDKKEYKKAKEELNEIFKEKQWAKGFEKLKIILAYPKKEYADLIDVAIFSYYCSKNNTKRKYEYIQICNRVAYLAYMHSESNLQKAQALMLYMATCSWGPSNADVEEIKNLYSIEKLRAENPKFKDILKFEYVDHKIKETPEGAVLNLNFSQLLNVVQPENYLEISPKVDGFVQANGSQISISGFQAGIEYSIKVKPGITSILGEKIDTSTEFGFFVKDLKPRISFPNGTCIYPKQEKICFPIRTINIDKARATLYHIPDRGIINHMRDLMTRSYRLESAEKIFSSVIDFDGKAKPNQTITKNLDATKAIPELKPGIYVLEVTQKGVLDNYRAQVSDQWFIVTDIGLTTFHSDQALLVHARAFSSAKPLKNIQLELISVDNDVLATVVTDEDGFAEFSKELLNGKASKKPFAIFAKNEELGFSFISLATASFDLSDRGVKGRTISNNYDAMVFCERGIYRPDEKINIASILRDGHGKEVPVLPLTFIVRSPKGIEIKRETIKGNALGTYSTECKLPADCPIGMWSLEAFVDPTKPAVGSASFRVDDFSPNKIEMTLTTPEKIARLGLAQTCTLSAYYLYGSAVSDRQALLEAKISPSDSPFEQWGAFHFGLDNEPSVARIVTGTTASIQNGKAELKVDVPKDLSCSKALRIDLNARLTDTTSSQQAAASVTLLTQPYIIGIREKAEHPSGEVTVEIIAVDENGNLVAAEELEYTFFESEAHYQWYKSSGMSWGYQRVYQDKPFKRGDLSTKSAEPVLLSFKGESATPYAIEISHKNGTKLAKYRIGKQYSSQKDRPDTLNITPEAKTTKLGEHAILKVHAPFEGEAIIIAGLNSVQLKDTVHLKQGVNILKIPTHENWGSGAYVMVSLVRPLDKKTSGIQAKRAVGIQWIQIDPSDHTLKIKLDLPEKIKPKTQLKVPVHIENYSNQDARLMLAIVDEGVMGLTNFKTPDPIEYFFGQRQLGLEMHDVYGYLIDPVDAEVMDMRTGGDSLMLRRGAFVPRINDKVLSFFDGDIHLDSKGMAEIVMDIPVFFGKLRVYAVAITNGKMGSQSGEVIVKDDLIVDPNLPSFLTVDDESDLHVRLENTTDRTVECQISINLEKAFKSSSKKQTVTLAPKEQKRFSILAQAKQIGEGVVQIEVKGEGVNYQHVTSVEVRSAYQPVLVSQRLEIKPKEKVDLKLEDLLKGLHTFQAQADLFLSNLGSWNTGKIQKWLINNTYSCNQQTISKGFAGIFGVKQSNNDALNPDRIEYQRVAYEAIEALNERQNSTGGWSIWPRDNDDSSITAYALEMLIYAKKAGLEVPKILIEKAMVCAKRQINSIGWKIKQYKEKVDSIAWLVKLCAMSQEIDTATTRYCFDEYFEKSETIAAKSLFIAAVASIQDLARVQKGIEELKEDIKKGVSLDEVAAVAAHLSPFKTIESVNQLIESLEKILHEGINADITHLNTQTITMLLIAAADYLPTSATDIKLTINKTMYNEKSFVNHILNPLQDVTIQNHKDESIWLFVNTYGIPSEPMGKKENGVNVVRTFYKPDGTKINHEDIILGDRIIVVLEVKVENSAHEGRWLISDWLPAGFFHSNTLSNYEWLKDVLGATIQKRHDRLVALCRQPANTESFKIAYEVVATHIGKFQQPGLYVENMINPAQYATYSSQTIIVKEEKPGI
jgi:uncharacterized protein YfaS (alpha-2-macroglobulin family)